ncbi:hypothetical protein VE02_00295 [Pseudogymnoascus sp. 03VT05]|nr:hypothetical protein VE02_00295 [Pseudogymnoascus sp. 03VT05]
MAPPAPKISITDVTGTEISHEGDADDEYFETQEGLSPQSTSTFTQKVIVSEEVTAEQGSCQVTGQVTGQVVDVEATKSTVDGTGKQRGKQRTSRKVKVSQATGTITGELPNSKDAKQVKVSGQVTEVTATQELTDASGPGIGPSTPRTTRSIRKAISAVLDGSPFRSSLSNSEGKPLFKDSGELNSSNNSTPKPKPVSQTAADPPRPPMDGYEWVWFPAGYWAEREIITRPTKNFRPPKWVRRSLQESGGSTVGSPIASAPRSLNPSEVWAKNPADLEDEEAEEAEGDGPQGRRASSPPGIMNPDKGTSTPKAILRKFKQISRKASSSGPSAGKGKGPEESRPESPPIDLERQTTNTLRGTSRFFSQFLATKKRNDRAMHPLSPDEQSLKVPRKRFGLAPWHQNDSGDTVRAATATSSIRELLFGKTPASTPQPDATPADPNLDQYFRGEVHY